MVAAQRAGAVIEQIQVKGICFMKPEYWLGIMPVVGAVIGAILGFIFPNPGTNYAVYGTALGVGVGLVMYASQKSKSSKKEQ